MFLSKFKIQSQEDLVETPTAIHAEQFLHFLIGVSSFEALPNRHI